MKPAAAQVALVWVAVLLHPVRPATAAFVCETVSSGGQVLTIPGQCKWSLPPPRWVGSPHGK